MSPRLRLSAFACLATALLSLPFAAAAASRVSPRPNVLVVITDDQGYGDFSLHGNPHLKTPELDRFGREGIQFDRFFVSPVCAPTRASLLTGRWWLRGGVHGVTQSRENLRLDEVTLPQTLRGAGYRTGMFGKWHNGEQYPYTPPGRGFDEFLGFNNGHWNNYFDADVLRGAQLVPTQGFLPDVLTDAAIEFMSRPHASPFFCYVSYNTPHSPYQAPDRFFAPFKAQGLDDVLAAVYAMCANIDENFGRLLRALEQHGLRENTIVLFLTDNGANTDRFNAGMRGRKGSLHEGGTRVPLLVQWPARFDRPRVIPQITAHIDLYPTLLELCGISAPPGPPLDGVSLVPLLSESATPWPERLLFAQNSGASPHRGAVRSSRYRAVLESAPAGPRGNAPTSSGWQLYDMVADPGQHRDIAAERPEVVRKLSTAYDAWFRDVTRDGFAKPRIPVGYAEHDPVPLYAPQANFTGSLRFHHRNGFSHDWISGWTAVDDQIGFDLDVVRGGTFAVELVYACPPADAGARIRVSAGDARAEATLPAAPAPRIPLPHRNGPDNHYINRVWGVLPVGELRLEAGPQTLTIQALTRPGVEVMEFKQVHLRRVR